MKNQFLRKERVKKLFPKLSVLFQIPSISFQNSFIMNETNNDMPYLKYFIDGLPPELVKKAEIELGETEEVKAECLKELRSLIKNEPDFEPCMEDAFLLRFLRSKKYKVEKAFKTLKNFYTYKATYSGILTDFTPSELRHVSDKGYGSALEYRDASYTAIGLIRLSNEMERSDFDFTAGVASALICTELGVNIEATAVAGYAIIFDCKGVSINTVKKFASPTLIYRILTAIQDVIPCRIKGYHVINQPYFFHIFLTIAKSFMTEKLASRLYLHGKNMESLYEHVPRDILPEELGGKQGPMTRYIFDQYLKKLYSMEDHFIKMRKYGYKGKTLKKLQEGNNHVKT